MTRNLSRHHSHSVERERLKLPSERSRSLDPRVTNSRSLQGEADNAASATSSRVLLLPCCKSPARRESPWSPSLWNRTPRRSGRHPGLSRLSLRSATPMSRASSKAESGHHALSDGDAGRRSMPLATYRHGDWTSSSANAERPEEVFGQSQGNEGRALSLSGSVMSEDSISSRSRVNRVPRRKHMRQSRSMQSVVSSTQMLTSLLESSRPDLQVHRESGYSLKADTLDYQILSEGLLHGSIFGALADQLSTLAPLVELYRFGPGELVSKKEFSIPYVLIVRDGCFIMSNPKATSGGHEGHGGEIESFCLGPCCVFGEIDLWAGELHVEVCAGDLGGTCFAISKDAFLEALQKASRESSMSNFQLLTQCELFRFLDTSYLAMLSKCSSNIHYLDKAVIRNMDNGSFMYVVKKGQVIEARCRDRTGGEVIHGGADCITCLGGQLMADGPVELMTWHMPSLHALLGQRGSDFFWRCEVLSELRQIWSHRVGFGSLLDKRSSPEEIARACIIMTFLEDSVDLVEFLSPLACESTEWFMLLEGRSVLKASDECCSLKPYDSMILSEISSSLPISLGPDRETGPSTPSLVTLAVLPKDAILLGEEGDLDFKLSLIQQIFLFRTLDSREQQLLASASRLVPRISGQKVFKEGDLASQCFVVVEGEMAQWKEGRLLRTLGAFNTFGEGELLSQSPRNFTVTCKSETALLMAIDKMVFEHVVKERVFAQLQDQLQLRPMDIDMTDLQEISTLGYGTFGIVRLVQHQPSGARYALKCISRTEAAARRQQASICAEREILTDVDHPFILKLVQTFKDQRNVYFLTEFVTGGELFNAIRALGILNGSQARFYTGSLILALQALHEKKIIYRDLKPENVLLDNYGYIKLIDFGCAARLDRGAHRSLVGTPHYMAPEVILGKEYNCSCDVWSLGVCLYEFVCGPLPFGQDLDDPKEVFQDILSSKLCFPEHFTNVTGKHLLRSLLRKNSQLRIGDLHGLQDVREHEYFRRFSFVRLLGRNLEPPLMSSPTPRDMALAEDDEGAHLEMSGTSLEISAESEDWAAEF